MIPTPIPKRDVLPGTLHQTFAAPAGMADRVEACEALVARDDPANVPTVSVRLELEPGELEALQAGTPVWLTVLGGLTPFLVRVTDRPLVDHG